MKKKMIALLLCACMLGALMTACTDKESVPREDEVAVNANGEPLVEAKITVG